MASHSKKGGGGKEKASPSRKGSKSRDPPVVALDPPRNRSPAPKEVVASEKSSRLPATKLPTSRSLKIKLPIHSSASQTMETPSGTESVAKPTPPGAAAMDFMSLLGGGLGTKFKTSREEIPASVGSSKRPRDSFVEGGSTGEGGELSHHLGEGGNDSYRS